ncbi:hypothetical protein M407DRAFT_28954 [Tulasnella calospora MUT 4182]|uniref:Cytochrome P450 n=1 Tax=Tulasnella calospora MUT 4182 TaxID=1051891 RepID=A0A0C3KJ05_9AGAM|nr:hypothetical protein M407DRAFT_28954 [Tulasnella calospora MUT 4182]
MSPLPYLIGAVCGLPFAYLALAKWIRPKPLPGIPHFPVTSFWGDIPRMARDMRTEGTIFDGKGFLAEAFQSAAPIWQMFVGPSTKMVVVADAQEMEDFLNRATRSRAVDQSEIMLTASSGTIPYGMVSLKSSTSSDLAAQQPATLMPPVALDDMWRKHRRITNPLMTSKYLKSMTPAIANNARSLIRKVKSKGATCFSCEDDFHYIAIDAITSITLGESVGAVAHARSLIDASDPDVDDFGGIKFQLASLPVYTSVRYLIQCIGDATSMPPAIFYIVQQVLRWTPKFNAHHKFVVNHIFDQVSKVRQAVKEARDLGEEYQGNCLIGMIAEREGLAEQESLSDWELRDEVLTYIFELFSVKYLTENPQVQHLLHSELLSALEDVPQDRPLTFDDMMSTDKTPYLEAVVAEILRCGKVAPAASKQATSPIEILGRTVPAGTDILWCTHIACDNATIFNESKLRTLDEARSETSRKNGLGGRSLWSIPTDKFEPDRWIKMDENTGKKSFDPRAGYSFPFGVGLRSCAGKHLATLELKIYIATLSLSFFLAEVPKELSSHRARIEVTRFPVQAYVAHRPWT